MRSAADMVADGNLDGRVAGAPEAASPDTRSAWELALLTAAVLATDPFRIGGVRLRARPGPVRERWLEELTRCLGMEVPIRRVASSAPDATFVGGLDFSRTMALGRPVVGRGLLAGANGGVLVLGMAERASPALAAIIGSALDRGEVQVERDGLSARHPARFALVALDEGIDEEAVAPALAERLGLLLELDPIGWRETTLGFSPDAVAAARVRLPAVVASREMAAALCSLALAYGGSSLRLPMQLLHAARACAALRGGTEVSLEDADAALRLVFALQAPPGDADTAAAAASGGDGVAPPSDHPRSEPSSPANGLPENRASVSPTGLPEEPHPHVSEATKARDPVSADALQDMLIAAIGASLPSGLLDRRMVRPSSPVRNGSSGKAGLDRSSGRRGRAVGTMATPPFPGARPDIAATLRQAAPWQRLRSAALADRIGPDGGPLRRLHIRQQDFRYLRRRERTGSTAIFAVDASGSAAVERLAETKGAIELLLADCYVRRDSVGLIAFRGPQASTLLEPTRSLMRAKRNLSALPGGGGTPLASGIMAALDMARAVQQKGQSVMTVFLTDGRGNIALDGSIERDRVSADTARAAQLFRRFGLRAIVIDTARREQARAQELGRALGAEYIALPRGGAGLLAQAVGARMDG